MMANTVAESDRNSSNTKDQLSPGQNLSESDVEDENKWRRSNESKLNRKPEHDDPAILSTKNPAESPILSTSEPDVRTIRYSRESLLCLRYSALTKRRPEHIGRAWSRIGISNDGDPNDGSGLSRFEGGSRGEYSASSSSSSLANASSSSYLLPSFACKRRVIGTAQSNNEIKRSSVLTPKKDDPNNSPTVGGGNGSLSTTRRSVSNNRNSGNTVAPATGNSAEANRDRRIGSGRIPLRDSWNDVTSPSLPKPAGKGNEGAESDECPTKSGSAFDQTNTSTTVSSSSTAVSSSNATTGSSTSTSNSLSSNFNLRPGGGLLGLRDRQRENEQQQQQSQSTIGAASHPHIARTILSSNNSILDKDRSDFRERSVLGDERDRYERRPFNRDRDYGISDVGKDRNPRMGDSDRMPGGRYNSNSARNDRMNSYSSQYNYNDNRRRYDSRAAEEPEWFSGGPTSQNDTIELRGFDEWPSRTKGSKRSQRRDQTVHEKLSQDSDNGADRESDNDREAFEDYDDSEHIDGGKANIENERPNDANNNDETEGAGIVQESGNENEPDESADRKANKNEDNFNFDEFLKVENITDFLSNNEICKEAAAGESRFSRWFQTGDESKKLNFMQEPPSQKNVEINHNENNAENFFAPGNAANPSAVKNSFLEFLQKGKFSNVQKSQLPQHLLPNHQLSENNNADAQAVPHVQPPQALSVEELEARLRQSGPPNNSAPPPSFSPDSSGMRNLATQQQDMVAFKKLLQQISNENMPPQIPLPLAQQQQSHEQLAQQHHSEMEFKKMLAFGGSQASAQAPNQQSCQLIHPAANMANKEALKKMMFTNMLPNMPLMSPQQRMEILKRPEAQVLIQRLGNGELNQGFLLQQLSNPNVSQRDREIIIATLGNFNPTIPFPDANASNPPNNIVPMPNNVMNNQLPVPNAAIPPIPAPNNAPLSNDMIRHLYLQAVAGQKQQLRISPLPNGIPQRIPSPRELQFHTQSIMQNALIKKKLEEQRENFRKRQELQQQQQQQPNQPQQQQQPPLNQPTNSIQNAANSNNGHADQICDIQKLESPKSFPMNQPMNEASNQLHNEMPAPHHNFHQQNYHNQQMNRGASPSLTSNKQLNQNQHTASPTPTLAFTPTSVLRKMTAEKENDNSNNPNSNTNPKDVSKQPQLQQQQPMQPQQPQPVFDNMMSFPMRNEAGEMPINDLMRMLQVQPRPADKDSEHQMPIGVNGNNKDMNKMMNQQNIPQHPMLLHPLVQHPNMHAFRMQQNASQQAQTGPQQMPQQMQGNKFPPPQQQLLKPQGRPIVKGGGMANQFPGSEFPQNMPMNLTLQQQQNQRQFMLLQQHRQQQHQMQQHQFHHAQQFHHMMQQQTPQQMLGGPQMQHEGQQANQQAIHPILAQNLGVPGTAPVQSACDGSSSRLSPTSNQLAQWFSPELLAQASAGKLPLLDVGKALSLEEFERNMHSSTTVNN